MRILLSSEARRRRATYALVCAVFAATTAGLCVLVGAVDGFRDAVGHEIGATLTADHRLADGDPTRLAQGEMFENASAIAGRLEAEAPGAVVVPRIELAGLFLASDRYEDFGAGLLVGIDPEEEARLGDLRIVEGRGIDAESVWIDGAPYPQLVVGAELLEKMGRVVYAGEPDGRAFLNVSAGRVAIEGGAARPVVKEGVIVGAYRTGFSPVDESVVFLHRETALQLMRLEFAPDTANVLLVSGDAPSPPPGLSAASAEAFLDEYLASVFVPLGLFTNVVTGVVLAIAGGWVAHVAVDAVLSDHRRIAVLRAIGAPAWLVGGPLALLVLAAAALGALLGVGLGRALARILSAAGLRAPGFEHLPFVADAPLAETALLALLVLGVAAAAALAGFAALRRVPVTDALRS